jgi:hypothetical protein
LRVREKKAAQVIFLFLNFNPLVIQEKQGNKYLKKSNFFLNLQGPEADASERLATRPRRKSVLANGDQAATAISPAQS